MLVHALHLLRAMQTSLYIRIQIFQEIHLLVRRTRNRKNLERRAFIEVYHGHKSLDPWQTWRGGGEIPNYGAIRLAGPC